MAVPQVDNLSSIVKRLANKPIKWKTTVYVRAALRALPTVANTTDHWLKFRAIALFQANFVAWAALTNEKFDVKQSARRSHESLIEANRRNYDDRQTWDAIAHALAAILAIDGEEADHIFDWRSLQHMKVNNTHWDLLDLPNSINSDCDWLESRSPKGFDIRELIRSPLWLNGMDSDVNLEWRRLSSNLLRADPNYLVWIDWYERRIRGERASFDIPGDKGRIEDKKILRRLAEASDEDFWGMGHEYVNATLKGWLDEARERVAPAQSLPVGIASETSEAIALPPMPTQNRNAISFRTDENGKIAIDATALVDQLRRDAGALARYGEAAAMANAWLGRCAASNAGARLTQHLTDYLAAIGESVADAEPSLIILRGERLRQELARYDAPDHMLPPVGDELLLDGKGWQSAHNLMVALDPVLNATDTAMLGPDRQPTLIPPSEIKEKIEEADEAGILAEETAPIVIDAADLAPVVPDPQNRLSISTSEMARNLFSEAAAAALNSPVACVSIVAGAAIIAPTLSVGAVATGTVVSAVPIAAFLVKHRKWISERMGNYETWQAVFDHLADWLENNTMFEPKQ
jgi:hypothetical protein